MLPRFLSHLLAQLQHLQGGHGDGDAVVEHALPRHLGVDDLAGGRGRSSDGEPRPRPAPFLGEAVIPPPARPQTRLGARTGFGEARGQPHSPAPGRTGTPGTWPTPDPGRPGRSPRPRRATPRRGRCPSAPLRQEKGGEGPQLRPSARCQAAGGALGGAGTYCCAPRLARRPPSRIRSLSLTCPRCCPRGS